jgi:serine/threonine protein kinase/tetratricopeptide (TPR) repeat protein
MRTELVCRSCKHANPADAKYCLQCGQPLASKVPESTANPTPPPVSPPASSTVPASFANGRYQVKKFLGEGGKKKVYLAHDSTLDRDVAFALIKTEKLDEAGRTRVKREAQAMARLDHPNIVSVLDFGDHEGQPFMVLPLLSGGDVEGLIKKAPDHKLAIDQAVAITKAVASGLVFAHAKSIIHRDIKPGNVWLSGDGTAKIGDFGLAVALDLSRLTQHGMMVGTVSYMPPEQAMGGDVTAKADLYSLGAMLYEMVTGRPPFVGDDSVAIIGQHINTPPVSPTWHRADLPPALETLIMQLLEKDPQRRPASATLVLQALDSINTSKAQKEVTKESSPSTENPLYRRVFVGREPELKQLQSAFDGAISGQGALMMVMGEPGIGKTSLCEQLATYVTLRGGRTLVGHCYEEGSLSLPYLAFVEAMRSYVLSREDKDLEKDLGTGAEDVARIVSEIRERLKIQPRAQKDPEEDRYRLLQAVTSFLSNASKVQPLVVVLEDLHDADKGTLEMLTHLSRNLAGTRLLIIGTYRDVEVDRNHPLSATLADLRRAASFGRVQLRGLNADEVRRMLESITRESVPWGLAEAVHKQTEGNPLFVQEVIRFLAEEGLLVQKEGRWRTAKDTPLEMSIPEGLRDVIGRRLSLLSKECNQLVSVAAVIGREFRLEVLQKVAGISDEDLFATLEQAKKAAVIEERSGVGAAVTYRFAHAFFRQTLYEETIAPRRIRLHVQVAKALEGIYANSLEEHAAELAEHFSYSSDSDLKKAVSYGEMAAKRAMDVYAYGEAVRLLDHAIKVQNVLDPEDKGKACDLLLALCDALRAVPDVRRILDLEAPAAFALAEAMADSRRASIACFCATQALSHSGAISVFASPEAAKWVERFDRYAKPDTADRVRADIYLGFVKVAVSRPAEATPLLTRALNLARHLGNLETFWFAAGCWLEHVNAPQHAKERLRLAEELAEASRAGLSIERIYEVLQYSANAFLASGQRQRAEDALREHRDLAQRTGLTRLQLHLMRNDAILAGIDGRLMEAVEICRRIRDRGEELGLSQSSAQVAAWGDLWPLLHLGQVNEALESATHYPAPEAKAVCLAYLNRNSEVEEILERRVLKRSGIGIDADEVASHLQTLSLAAAVLIRNKEVTGILLNRFASANISTTGERFPTCIPRHLGAAAALLGRNDEARKHYQEAIRVTTEMRFRPELALSRLQVAELLLERYPDEKAEAIEHLDFAIKEFREMKMQPSLERALRQKKILKA